MKSIYIPRGIDVPVLNETKLWPFKPTKKVGDYITPGDIFGHVKENSLFKEHRIMIPPHDHNSGKITFIAAAGEYNVKTTLCKVEDKNGNTIEFNMVHEWPVRIPRPCIKKVTGNTPLLTG